MFACPATDDFFRSRIDHMIDLRHPLAVQASRMPWQEIEARVTQTFSCKGRAGVAMPDLDRFTDSRLLEAASAKLVQAAKSVGIALKQTHAKEGAQLSRKAGRYAHARQFKRMKSAIKRQRAIVGSLQRNLCAWHAPEVDCISTGKARTPYEFGVKVGIASTLKGNLIVGAKSFHGNPYDGHTLNEQLEQATILMQDSAAKPTTAFVDLGYRDVDAQNPDMRIVHRGKAKRISEQERQLLKRRQAIEPIIGHLKSDNRMDRCHLKGETGDRLHAVLCAAGYNIRWLLRIIAKKGVAFLAALLLSMRQVATLSPNWAHMLRNFAFHEFRTPAQRLGAG